MIPRNDGDPEILSMGHKGSVKKVPVGGGGDVDDDKNNSNNDGPQLYLLAVSALTVIVNTNHEF